MRPRLRKPRILSARSKKAGLPPGTLVHVGEKRLEAPRITYIDYDQQTIHEQQVSRVEDCFGFKTTPTVSWINIDGLHEVDLIQKLGDHYELHPLLLEDVLSTGQRPKFEDYEEYLFVVIRVLTYNGEGGQIETEQVSFVVGPNYVISFQERVGDVFEQIRERIRSDKGRVRKMGADYLAYSLIDATVDSYFAVLEKIGERIEVLEEELVGNPTGRTLRQIHSLKGQMIGLRRSVWPLREVLSGMQRSESKLIQKATTVYLRDVYDHTIQIIDMIESLRDMVSGMLDTYLSSISNRMNNVMRVLTIIATIFIPLTFIAGVYGMNFEHMPELKWRWGYAAVWLVMLAVGAVMLVWFRRKKWL